MPVSDSSAAGYCGTTTADQSNCRHYDVVVFGVVAVMTVAGRATSCQRLLPPLSYRSPPRAPPHRTARQLCPNKPGHPPTDQPAGQQSLTERLILFNIPTTNAPDVFLLLTKPWLFSAGQDVTLATETLERLCGYNGSRQAGHPFCVDTQWDTRRANSATALRSD